MNFEYALWQDEMNIDYLLDVLLFWKIKQTSSN